MTAELKNIGAQMANVMFNLAQRPGETLTSDDVAIADKLRKQWDAAVRATPPSPSTAPMCERKTAMLEGEGYAKTGYVLRQPGKDREVAVCDGGAVSWFTLDQWNWLMFNRDHVEFQWPKPIGAAPIAEGELPPLPKPEITYIVLQAPAYSEGQMRAYGQECARAALAANPAAREAARQSIDTPEFRNLAHQLYMAGVCGGGQIGITRSLIAHIDTWGGAALAANAATQKEE